MYSNKFKELINNLNEDKIYGVIKGDRKTQEQSPGPNENILDQLTLDKVGSSQADKIANPDHEKKEALKFKILNESRNYYENNLNIFSNGMSLMSVNSLEMH